MLFNSFEFLIFLPIVFILYWFVFKQLRYQNILIVIASYVFYGWWDKTFLLLIALTTICSYASGLLIKKYRETNTNKILTPKAITTINIIINIGILFVFKYFNFFAESFTELLKYFGATPDKITLKLILPVGISFYTFQALSYTIDIYRKKLEPSENIVDFFAFISFFPQLVAGPIERATNLLPQFQKPRKFDYALAVDGLRQMLWGFFKKLVVADNCADVVEQIFTESNAGGFRMLFGGIVFAFQIYCDFSGYSDIAIGTAKLFGIKLMRNFNIPYFSRSVGEFWQRWHISLMTWFRDYIYFPLGGSRKGNFKTVLNSLIVFLISGLWHGANWTFVFWGLYNGILISIQRFLPIKKHKDVVASNSIFPNIKEVLQMGVTFFLIVLGWIIFRSDNITMAFNYITRIFTIPDFNLSVILWAKKVSFFIALTIAAEWLQRKKKHVLDIEPKGILKYHATRIALYAAIFATIFYFSGKIQTFIYFQF